MKHLVFLILVSVAISIPAVRKEFVDYLKKNVKWKVAEPEQNKFRDWTIEEIKSIMNVKPNKKVNHYRPSKRPQKSIIKRRNYDDEFDFRLYFPECVNPIRDEMNCGASWSFATVTAFEQRMCMYTGEGVPYSVQDPISCSEENEGCDGGYLEETWNYFESTGVVDEDCFPYSSGEGDVEPCPTECKNGQKWKKHFASDVWPFWDQTDIMEEISSYGPVSGSMDVYEDFLNYIGGDPYQYFTGDLMGTIGVTILGYGYDFDDNYYWICQNSWGEQWGDWGNFKIYFGECRIDKDVSAGMPVTDDSKMH